MGGVSFPGSNIPQIVYDGTNDTEIAVSMSQGQVDRFDLSERGHTSGNRRVPFVTPPTGVLFWETFEGNILNQFDIDQLDPTPLNNDRVESFFPSGGAEFQYLLLDIATIPNDSFNAKTISFEFSVSGLNDPLNNVKLFALTTIGSGIFYGFNGVWIGEIEFKANATVFTALNISCVMSETITGVNVNDVIFLHDEPDGINTDDFPDLDSVEGVEFEVVFQLVGHSFSCYVKEKNGSRYLISPISSSTTLGNYQNPFPPPCFNQFMAFAINHGIESSGGLFVDNIKISHP